MTVTEFENFIAQYENDIFTFCNYLANNYHIACDLYQETALAAFEMASRIDPTNNPKSLLMAIAAGKWKNMRKKALGRARIAPEIPLEDYTPTGEGNPVAQAVETTATHQALATAIAGMKDKYRIPLILFYFDNCPTEAIATICAIPQGTVKSRLHKARALLKKQMEKEGFCYE